MRYLIPFAFAAAVSGCADTSKTSDPNGPVQAPVAAVPVN